MRTRRLTVGVLAGLALTLLLVIPALASGLFSDVPATHPYVGAIENLATRGIIGGYTNGDFGPQDPVVRQQFAKMVVKTLNLTVTGSEVCPFIDVDLAPTGTDPFYPAKYVAVCAQNGITNGTHAMHFSPWDNITRQQVITMVVRAADNLAPGSLGAVPAGWNGVLSYGDPTHGTNLKKAEYNGLLGGLEGLSYDWNASANASRGECAQLLYNLLQIHDVGTSSTTSTTSQPTTSTTVQPTTTTTVAPTTTTTSGGTTVYITTTGTKYHRDGCRYLSDSKIAISLSEAKAQGYTPCGVCKPPQ